ncbi:hypothetical protein CBR_g27957 [Chara braunii]|uniref:Reverse transcriptase domain-containing protein n=1 Tax=Chara braunii TaxID=69332 RepID=A0A388L918_CHABU|nr:hypothetical protein CBR_g27957 [Chara braunii]|eukprot:GBG78732.1 hypothetical protein CBR_g27957 [Chara braunii]
MTTEFRDLLDRSVLIYLDDILVYSRPLDEHIIHLRAVLNRLRLAKYKANRDKCEFAKQELEYLGHYVTPKGIGPSADKIQAIVDWPEPRCTTDVLEQCHEDSRHPVEYFSQKVPLVNTLDDARKKELLAFVTVLKRWRHFLLGRRRFIWNTDNNPLTFYKTQDTVTSTIGRWMYYIDQFDFDPCHIPGPANRVADTLSRRPDLCAIVTTAFDLEDDLQPHFVKGYKSDPTYSTLYAELSSDNPPASHYRISDEFLLLHTRGKDLLVVPQDRILRTRLLGEFHDARLSAHLGVNRTLERLHQRFHWPDVLHDVTRYIESCAVCHRKKGRSRVPFRELKPLSIPRAPRLSIAMDVTGPFPRDRHGHDAIFTVVDRLSNDWSSQSPSGHLVRIFVVGGSYIELMSYREEQQPDGRILRSARRPIAHLALGPEGDRYLFHQRRERLQQQQRARDAEASRALASKAAALVAMASAAQQTSQAGSSGTVGSTAAQTQSRSAGVMASQSNVLSPEEIAIQQAALQEAQLQKALGEIKAEKEGMIRRVARMQRREADVRQLEEMNLTNMDTDVRTVRTALLGVIEAQDHQTAILQDIHLSLAWLVGQSQAAPLPSGPGAWPVAHLPPPVPPVSGVSPYVAPSPIAIVSLGMPLLGGLSAGPSVQIPVQTVLSQPPSQVAISEQSVVPQPVQPQGSQPQEQQVQQPFPQSPQPSVGQIAGTNTVSSEDGNRCS